MDVNLTPQRVSIISRGIATRGDIQQHPTADRHLMTRSRRSLLERPARRLQEEEVGEGDELQGLLGGAKLF